MSNSSNRRIEEFTAWGAFVKAWGWGAIDGTTEASQVCTEESGCAKGLTGGGAGEFGAFGPQGVAVDSAGDVYVVDLSNRRVQKFAPDGGFVLTFGGDVNKTKVEAGGATEAERNLCTAASGDVCQAGTEGTGQGQFGNWSVDIGNYIAVDPGPTPAEDRIYVGDQNRIQVFDPEGHYLEAIAVPGETVQSLATDAAGKLYVAYLSATLNNDKANVRKLDPESATPAVPVLEFAVSNPRGVAVDPEGGQVYALDKASGKVLRFSPAGAKEEELAAGLASGAIGIAVGGACGNGASLYLANASLSDSFLRSYGTLPESALCPPPEHAPDINDQFAGDVGTDNATLRAAIDPWFWPDTTYHLQYATEACIEAEGWEGACVEAQPEAPGTPLKEAGKLHADRPVAIVLSGLAPGTAYRYRFVAQSGGSEGMPVRGLGGAVGADGADGAFATFPLPADPKTDCPNQAHRAGPAARLPDCRAHEMVSPVDKANGDVVALVRGPAPIYRTLLEQSARDGERLAYSSATAFGDALSAPYTSQYIASRLAGREWSTHAISPPRESKNISGFANFKTSLEFKAFSEDLCSAWLIHDTGPLLDPPAGVPGFLNPYRRDNCGPDADGYEALSSVEPPSAAPEGFLLEIQGGSAVGTPRSFFIANDELTAEAASLPNTQYQLYVSAGGQLRYVCLLPDGSAAGQCTAGTASLFLEGAENTVARAVSEDGSRVYWTAAGTGTGPLYIRLNPDQEQSALQGGDECTEPGKACTLALSGGAARFWTASTDGSTAIYEVGGSLYEYDLAKALAGEAASTEIAAGALGVAGASEDATRIYFVSTEKLTGAQENSEEDVAVEGQPNLYRREVGEAGPVTTYVATLSGDDVNPGSQLQIASPDPMRRASRVAPDGETLAFTSTASLTGYDNTDAASGEADAEVFLYDAASDELDCISCNPTGARPRGRDYEISGEKQGFWAAAQVPAWENQLYAPRALSEDGRRLFFESFEALVPRDANGYQDVYEWERVSGSGKAGEEECLGELGGELFLPEAHGCLGLISSGRDSGDSELADADPSAKNVFFRTGESLLPQDPGLVDVYDAREGGGLPTPAIEPPCEGEACQSPAPGPDDPTPASAAQQGSGNLGEEAKPNPRRCPKGKRKVRRAGRTRCVKKKQRHRRHARHHRRGHRRAAR